MIALLLLGGLAVWVATFTVFGWSGVVGLALVCLAAVVLLVGVDELQARHDRRTAYRRWREWFGG